MYFSWHLCISLIFAIPIIFLFSPIFALLFLLASIGVDFDHYLFYSLHMKKKNPKKMIDEWHGIIQDKKDPMVLIFHNIEFFLGLSLATYFLESLRFLLFPIFLGIILHYGLDKIWDLTTHEHLKKRYWSIVLWLIYRNKE